MRQLRLGNLVIDRDRYCVFVGNQATRLSSKELGLLWHMARHAEKVLTREQLWRAVWGKEVNGRRAHSTLTSRACAEKLRGTSRG